MSRLCPNHAKPLLMREAVPTASLAHGVAGTSEQQDWHRIDPKQRKSWCYGTQIKSGSERKRWDTSGRRHPGGQCLPGIGRFTGNRDVFSCDVCLCCLKHGVWGAMQCKHLHPCLERWNSSLEWLVSPEQQLPKSGAFRFPALGSWHPELSAELPASWL